MKGLKLIIPVNIDSIWGAFLRLMKEHISGNGRRIFFIQSVVWKAHVSHIRFA